MSVLFKALEKAAEAHKAHRRPFVASGLEAPERPVLARRPTSHDPQPSYSPQLSHSAMWRALSAAAEAKGVESLQSAKPVRPPKAPKVAKAPPAPRAPARQPQYAPQPQPQPQPQPTADLPPEPQLARRSMEGLKRLGELGARLRVSESYGKPSPRPFRVALLALVTLLGGTLGALYYFGEDVTLIYEELMGEEPVRRAPPPRKPRQQIAEAPKTEEPVKEVAKPEAAPEPAKEEKAVESAQKPEPAPEPQAQTQPQPQPVVKPAPNAADAALDKVLADATRKAVREKEVAEKAATDLPSLMADVKQRRVQGATTPQIEVRKASGAPTSITKQDADSKIDMVRVRSASTQSREDAETAYGHLLSGRFEAASLLYAEVLKREPKNLAALTGRAAALHKLGQFGEARYLYEQALAINPGNREVLSNLMSIYGVEAPMEALRQLEGLQRDNPGYSPIPAQMASLYAQSGDLANAIRYQGLAVQLAPENVLYRFNLAVMQDRAGMAPEAASSYETVLAQASRGGSVQLPMPVGQVRERLTYLRTR